MRKMINASLVGLVCLFVIVCAYAQTKVVMPENKFPVGQDVAIRQQYEPVVRSQMKLLTGRPEFAEMQALIDEIGARLVSAVPAEYPNNGFEFKFVVIDTPDVNAFALPAGFIAINRGMLELCNNTDELAAVMAHEISHVVLRHTTAKMTKQSKFTFLELGILVAGSMGGRAGSTGAVGGLVALSIYQLKYDRQFEKQADLLGSQILVRAGYSAYNMQNVMRSLQVMKGTAGTQWLLSHPNPEKRVQYLGEEAAMLPVMVPPAPTHYTKFKQLQAKLKEQR